MSSKRIGLILFSVLYLVLLCEISKAGILPTSRGGTGANITPSNGAVITSTASGFAASTSLLLPSGFTIVVPAGTSIVGGAQLTITAGSTLATPQIGAFESNGTNLYWTDSAGVRHKLQLQ